MDSKDKAFVEVWAQGQGDNFQLGSEGGLTKLEYFTAKAMQGILARENSKNASIQSIADTSAKIAARTLKAIEDMKDA